MMQRAITFNLKNHPHHFTTLSAEDFFLAQGGFSFFERRVLKVRKARKIKNNTAIDKIFQRHSSRKDKSQSVAPTNFPPTIP